MKESTQVKKSRQHNLCPKDQLVSDALLSDFTAVHDNTNYDLVSKARRTIGLQSIYPEDVKRQVRLYGARDEKEARWLAAKEFLKCEMAVCEELFDSMEIEKIFPPAKEEWDMLYLRFTSESSVQPLYKHSTHLKNKQRLVPYMPKQFYPRYKELESLAYILRHSENNFKTRIRMGISDLVL